MVGLRVAVVGATGLVGRTIVRILEERGFPVDRLVALASARSAGTFVSFGDRNIMVSELTDDSFEGCDLVFFSAGASVSLNFAPVAARLAHLVVDNSSAFRADPTIPLVVPEVNGHLIAGPTPYEGIVANPNCSTIGLVVALQPLHAEFGLREVVVSTYQSVSGSGAKGVQALDYELMTGERDPDSPYPHRIAHNVLPHIAAFDESGWSGEEMKMVSETRKIMNLPDLAVVPTTVRVPVRVSHSESVYARFDRPVDVDVAKQLLQDSVGVTVEDEPLEARYPLAIDVEGRDDVVVGRIRQVPGDLHGLVLWVVSDNLRKGAATNAVQIAEQWADARRIVTRESRYA